MWDLSERHIEKSFELQLSGYYTGREKYVDGGYYYQSRLIPSTNWNHCINLNPSDENEFKFGEKLALVRGMPLAFFIREEYLEQLSEVKKEYVLNRERWMMCFPSTIKSIESNHVIKLTYIDTSKPNDDYVSVLGSLYEQEELNDRFRNFYIPTLNLAKLQEGTRVRHAVLYYKNSPVACGSVYISEGLAGIYNVGTKYGYGQNGFGSQLSHYLTNLAFEAGAESVFLQCVIGTHVEKLYSSLGYSSKECPGIAVFK